jgi:hypothetical protein
MSFLVVIAQFFGLLSGFDIPIFKESIADRINHIDVCASGGCVER